MDKEAIYEKLNTIFQDVFDDPDITVQAETSAEDIEDWDSLAQISLIVAVEEEFGIKFSVEEATSMKNVGEMVQFILEKS